MAVTTESQTLRLCNDEAGYAELCQILTALVVRRRQLEAMLVAERQWPSVAHPKAKPSIVQIMDANAAQLP